MTVAGWIWSELGIGLTQDVGEIRRAYARKLKVTQPEDDAEGFQRLRAAYERALAFARSAAESVASAEASAPPKAAAPVDAEPSAPRNSTAHVDPTPAAAPRTTNETHRAPAQASASENASESEPKSQSDRDSNRESAHNSDHAALTAAFTALQHTLYSRAPVPNDDRIALLQQVIHSPALHELTTYHQVELALASLLVSTQPASDELLPECIDRFKWDTPRGLRERQGAIAAVVARRRDLEFLETLQRGTSLFADEFKRLQTRSSRWQRLWRGHVKVSGASRELQLLATLQDAHPALLGLLDAGEVEWWTHHANQPRISLLGLIFSLLLGLVGIFAGAFMTGHGEHRLLGAAAGFAVTFGPAAGLLLGKLYLVDWPTVQVSRRISHFTSPWLTLGWFPLALVSMLVLSAVPLHPAFTWISIPLAAAVCLWPTYVTGPMPPLVMGNQIQIANSHVLMALVTNVVMLYWWLFSLSELDGVHLNQYFIPVAAALCAEAFGRRPLATFWHQNLAPRARYLGIASLAIVAAVLAAVVWKTREQQAVQHLVIAGVVAVVLLHRVMRAAWDRDAFFIAGVAFIGIAFGVAVFLGFSPGRTEPSHTALTGGGLMVLGSVIANLMICTYQEYRLNRPS